MIYSELAVFKLSHQFVLDIYRITKSFPSDERFRLVDQLIRASYSIPSNIAEGNQKNTTKDYLNFLYTSRGSANEVKYFILLSKDLNYIDTTTYQAFDAKITSIIKMLNALISSLKKKV
jgi:four helix bundle protein